MANTARTVIITSYLETHFNMGKALRDDDIVICTDGGYDIARQYGIRPALVIGDFDSITAKIPEDIPVVEFPPEKDFTDLQLAIDIAIENGCNDVEIWGGIGGRLDQTIANMQLLTKYSKEIDWLVIRDGSNEAFVIDGTNGRKGKLPKRDGWYVSFFSLTEECKVTVSGVKYPLDHHTLLNTFPLGVSNEFVDDVISIDVESGSLLVVVSRK